MKSPGVRLQKFSSTASDNLCRQRAVNCRASRMGRVMYTTITRCGGASPTLPHDMQHPKQQEMTQVWRLLAELLYLIIAAGRAQSSSWRGRLGAAVVGGGGSCGGLEENPPVTVATACGGCPP